jgi:putative Mn2+ efflux pump MntP
LAHYSGMRLADPLQILALAIGLGCDAFAVGLSVGTRWSGPRQVFRLAFHFGLFQFLMPLGGWLLGRTLLAPLLHGGTWLGAAILGAVGLKMLIDAFGRVRPRNDAPPADAPADGTAPDGAPRRAFDPTRGWSLVGLSLATSLDALAVGIGMGVAGTRLLGPALVIGVTAAVMTLNAMLLGRTLSRRVGRRLEFAGALLILAAAVGMLR